MSGTIDQKTYLKKFRGAFSLLSPPLDPPMHPHFSRKPSPKARSWPTLVWPVINLGEKSFRHRSERQPLHCFHRSPATGHAFLRLSSCPLSIAQKRVCDTRLALNCRRHALAHRLPSHPLLCHLTQLEDVLCLTHRCRAAISTGAQSLGPHLPPPKISKHCIAILTFAETFKE